MTGIEEGKLKIRSRHQAAVLGLTASLTLRRGAGLLGATQGPAATPCASAAAARLWNAGNSPQASAALRAARGTLAADPTELPSASCWSAARWASALEP